MKDGLVLFYIKDDVIFPVALTTEQNEVFEILMGLMPGTIRVVDVPQGNAVNLKDQLKEKSKAGEPLG